MSSSSGEQRVAFRSTAVVTGFEGKVDAGYGATKHPLSKLGEFFAQALPHSAHNVREMSITKSLSNVYNLQVQCDRVERLSQSVQVDPNTLCPVCHKRIGDIVFAVYPNGKVVHYNCTNSNLQLCPVTGERFS
ncbi:hypothetical protein AM588_10010661 [Phytophthora nicotianae]|uniref:Vacuolar sorting protein 39/Transforming growth factor beta receptor-associated zinc finger domain-containing protein n=1 Tax=Phytophthora nicotianae TaxID=4792 RepID=A0A0W8DN94_PHYNI|nr:hypothetical protein AM588_10010661 [Phytophthora nicotianae]